MGSRDDVFVLGGVEERPGGLENDDRGLKSPSEAGGRGSNPPTSAFQLFVYRYPCSNGKLLGSGSASGRTGNVRLVDSSTVWTGCLERMGAKEVGREEQFVARTVECVRWSDTRRVWDEKDGW